MHEAATDAADAALSEEPMRIQIERLQTQIAGHAQDWPRSSHSIPISVVREVPVVVVVA